MRFPVRRRAANLVVALVMLGAANPMPLHSDADHTAALPHVDVDHGAHDGILVQDLDDGALGGKIALPPVSVAQFSLEIPDPAADVPVTAPSHPPTPPPNYRPLPRAPPSLV